MAAVALYGGALEVSAGAHLVLVLSGAVLRDEMTVVRHEETAPEEEGM